MRLLCILANPPINTGARTLRRVELARELLDCTSVSVENLFSLATADVTNIAELGADEVGWATARQPLATELSASDVVLLAYGVSEPTGAARQHHRHQIRWLASKLARSNACIYCVGDGPRHPSRWQRWTARAFPGEDFATALKASFTRVTPSTSSSTGWGFTFDGLRIRT